MENIGHYVIIGIVICVIFYFQGMIYRANNKKIKSSRSIFPKKEKLRTITIYIPEDLIATQESFFFINDIDSYLVSKKSTDCPVTLIQVNSENDVFNRIVDSINTYLIRNKGAVSDFLLIKDIVGRNCDAEDGEIETQLPLPLYLGLMGTMSGIVIGLGYIAFGDGGFEAFIKSPEKSIGILMSGVAVAMLASLFGIVFTTRGSWLAKNAKSIMEAGKNEFYTWIQTELLPILSNSTANSLMMLQNNLLKFNDSFSSNVGKLNTALAQVHSSYESQIELMHLLDDLDIKQVTIANVVVLKELQNSTKEIEHFNLYMHDVNNYLNRVNQLNESVNRYLNRTAMIEKMGAFFEEELTGIEQRKVQISQAVGTVDNTLRKAFVELQENAQDSMNSMRESSIRQQNEFKKVIEEQKDEFREKIAETSALVGELKNLTAVKISMDDLKELTMRQNSKLDTLIDGIQALGSSVSEPQIVRVDGAQQAPVSLKYLYWGGGAFLFLLLCLLITVLYATLRAPLV